MMLATFDYDLSYPGPPFPVVNFDLINRTTGASLPLTGYIDTGADGTLIPIGLLQSIGARIVDDRMMRNVSNQHYLVRLYAVNIKIGQQVFYGIDVIGNEHTSEIIIGRDLLNQIIMTLNGPGLVTEIGL